MTTQTHRMLFVLIFAISFLANTISDEIFQAVESTCSVHYVFFWHFFHIQYKTNVNKKIKAKGQVGDFLFIYFANAVLFIYLFTLIDSHNLRARGLLETFTGILIKTPSLYYILN